MSPPRVAWDKSRQTATTQRFPTVEATFVACVGRGGRGTHSRHKSKDQTPRCSHVLLLYRGSMELHLLAQVVGAGLAVLAQSAGHTRLEGNGVPARQASHRGPDLPPAFTVPSMRAREGRAYTRGRWGGGVYSHDRECVRLSNVGPSSNTGGVHVPVFADQAPLPSRGTRSPCPS